MSRSPISGINKSELMSIDNSGVMLAYINEQQLIANVVRLRDIELIEHVISHMRPEDIVEAKDEHGRNILHFHMLKDELYLGADEIHIAITRRLLHAYPQLALEADKLGRTPLSYAFSLLDVDSIKLFFDYLKDEPSADLAQTNIFLHLAREEGVKECRPAEIFATIYSKWVEYNGDNYLSSFLQLQSEVIRGCSYEYASFKGEGWKHFDLRRRVIPESRKDGPNHILTRLMQLAILLHKNDIVQSQAGRSLEYYVKDVMRQYAFLFRSILAMDVNLGVINQVFLLGETLIGQRPASEVSITRVFPECPSKNLVQIASKGLGFYVSEKIDEAKYALFSHLFDTIIVPSAPRFLQAGIFGAPQHTRQEVSSQQSYNKKLDCLKCYAERYPRERTAHVLRHMNALLGSGREQDFVQFTARTVAGESAELALPLRFLAMQPQTQGDSVEISVKPECIDLCDVILRKLWVDGPESTRDFKMIVKAGSIFKEPECTIVFNAAEQDARPGGGSAAL